MRQERWSKKMRPFLDGRDLMPEREREREGEGSGTNAQYDFFLSPGFPFPCLVTLGGAKMIKRIDIES